MPRTTRDFARIALGLVRLVNGTIALVAPQVIIRRFSDDPYRPSPPEAMYALRMFGIRTILVAFDLLRPSGHQRSHAMRVAPLIHVSDLLTAALIARSGQVRARTGAMIVAISGLNTVLAVLMLDHATTAAQPVEED